MTTQKQSELQLKLNMMIGQLQQAVRAINAGNYIAAGVYLDLVQNQLPKARWQVRGKDVKRKDLIEDHEYISKNARFSYGVLSKRVILKINKEMSYVTYCEYKGIQQGIKAIMKTISIKSFLRWAVADVTDTKKLDRNKG